MNPAREPRQGSTIAGAWVPDNETVLIAGAGMVGLGAAMMLANGKRQIVLIERDAPPPLSAPTEIFQHWERKGVAQLRHSHIFLGRLVALLRESFPFLMEELMAAGARLFRFEDTLSTHLKAHYHKGAGDEDMALLYCRRTTLEFVLRRHVERLPGVSIRSSTQVRGLIGRHRHGHFAVKGLVIERGGTREDLRGDVVVDATGRSSLFPNWLRREGVVVGEEESPCGILYYTRHFALKANAEEPAFGSGPTAGDLGYLKFGICPADEGHFSITLAVPEVEKELRRAIIDPEIFDALCAALPDCARWTRLAVPDSPVYAMGNLTSLWRTLIKDGAPQVLNFFMIGDSAIHTNPLYGRGCAAGIVHAGTLREVLESTGDARERARLIEEKTGQDFRRHYDAMVKQDGRAIARAESERMGPGQAAPLKARIMAGLRKSLLDDGVIPALRGDLNVARAAARAFHMLDPPLSWKRRPQLFARVLWMWMRPRAFKKAARLYPQALGPKRGDMLAKVGLRA